MGSPPGSSTRIEDQERSRSYASMVGSDNRRDNGSYNQEFRGPSFSTGLEDQAMEMIRGLARPTQPAPAMDKLQEGIQLLTQMAQQAGRR